MDGARFDIQIEANNIGADASADALNAFVEKIQFVNKVATTFDKSVAAARARLEETTAAARMAADALGAAEARYKELEGSANKASKELEKVKVAGGDTTALQAAADASAAKMREQAAAVDDLRTKAVAAAAAQDKLAGTLKTLEGQQSAAAANIKKGIAKELEGAGTALKKVGSDDNVKAVKKAEVSLDGLKGGAVQGKTALLGYALAAVAAAGGAAYIARLTNPGAVMTLTAAFARFKIGIVGLFSGIKLDKFANGIADIMQMFDKGTSSANGLKKIIEFLFQPLLDGAAKAAPFVKEMFKGIIFGVLQVIIWILKLRNEILRAMSPETRAAIGALSDKIFTLKNFFMFGAIAGIALTAVLAALAIAELAALWPILLIVAAIALVVAAIVNWGDIVDWVSDLWDDFVTGLEDIWDDMVTGAENAATDLIDGLVNGIKKGAGKVVEAVKGLATGAIKVFTGSDGIDAHSPSKKFHTFGGHIPEGAAQGVEDGTPAVENAVVAMAAVPSSAAAPPASSGGASVTRSAPLIGSLTVNANTKEDAQSIADTILGVLENVAVRFGGGEAPAT